MLRRICCIAITVLSLFLLSCSDDTVIENSSLNEVSYHTEPEGTKYIINTSSKKYHLSDCSYAKNMKDEYKVISSDIDFIIERGYVPCSYCVSKNDSNLF